MIDTLTSKQDFLAAICAEPEDMDLRRIYCDWLTEQDEWGIMEAEHILYQIEHPQEFSGCGALGSERIKCQWGKYCHACQELSLLGIPNVFLGHNAEPYEIRRGFLEVIHCTRKQWEEHGPQVVSVQPITKVLLVDMVAASRNHAFYHRNDKEAHQRGWYVTDSPSSEDPENEVNKDIGQYLRKGKYNWHWYESEQEAWDDLSMACLKWARAKAARRRNQ